MSQIIAFGEALIDFFGEKGKGLKNSLYFTKCFGGAPANFAISCSRLGAKVSLITRISDDPFGDFLIETLKKEKVDTSFIKRTSKKTSLALVALDREGKPDFNFYWDNTSNIDVRKEDIKESLFRKAKIFHFCSLSLTTEPVRSSLFQALKLAKKHKLMISFNANLRPDLMRKDTLYWVKRALEYTDIFLLSKDELSLITKERNLDRAVNHFKIKKIIVTLGEEGSFLYEENKKIKVSAFKVRTIDTTGAGDAFSAGISVGLLKNYQKEELLKFANAVAALSIQKRSSSNKLGAISSLPTLKEVDKFLRIKNKR